MEGTDEELRAKIRVLEAHPNYLDRPDLVAQVTALIAMQTELVRRSAPPPNQDVGSGSNLKKFIASLNECHITRPDAVVLNRIVRSNRFLDLAALGNDYALEVYTQFKEMAGTQTKSFIGSYLNLKINGSVFEEFPFLLSAKLGAQPKMVKILRVVDGATALQLRQQDVEYEMHAAANFTHDAIVPTECIEINIDATTALTAGCRQGTNNVLVMPWYISTLSKFPSSDLEWIGEQGERLLAALDYVHGRGYVHMDVKSDNIFVTHDCNWILGDFSSCKPIGKGVTSCSFHLCYESPAFKPALVKYDWFMFLLLLLIESLPDRRSYSEKFYENGVPCADYDLVTNYAHSIVDDSRFGLLIQEVLNRLNM